MSSQSETGHYKNVVNLKALKTFASNLGPNYSPQKEMLKLPFLEALVIEATTLHNNVKEQVNTVNLEINNRQLIFEPVKSLSTRIINTMSSTNVQPKTIEDAKSINAKIQGTRINKKGEPTNPEDIVNSNSVSRQSYDSIYENFKSLNNLLLQDGGYNPEETDLSIPGLTSKENEMLTANENVNNENSILATNRIAREKRFYKDQDGLLAVAKAFKKYIRGKFGVSSPQFAQIKGLVFVDYAKK